MPIIRKKKKVNLGPKPSAVELLARISGKKRMEPTVNDATEEIEVRTKNETVNKAV
jgi:hypothetical protein